jgi:hypothetical protein
MRSSAILVVGAILIGLGPAERACAQEEAPAEKLLFPLPNGGSLELEGLVRGYYRNDQRIAWSGVEETLGAESVLRPLVTLPEGAWTLRARGEFFLNMPNGTSLLHDPVRDRFQGDFSIPTFQIFQLAVEAERGDWLIRVGRIATPLSQLQTPILSNRLFDAPFLRTEIIGFAETGLFVRWHPDCWSFDVGISNGEPDLDTNSSKALVARVGIDRPRWSAGIWIKAQDGIGSEELKRFNSFAGFDASVRFGYWTVYAEGLVDQHGLYRDLDAINPLGLSDRSLYGRDVNRAFWTPIWGGGFDVGATFRRDRLLIDWNYGVYFPQQIGVPFHDAPVNRGLVKCAWNLTERAQLFWVAIWENSRPQPFLLMNNSSPRALLVGAQIGF